MRNSISVDNIKCNGCAALITKKLEEMEGINNIAIDVANGNVSFDAEDNVNIDSIIQKLKKWGYPESGKGSTVDKAKSYVSCMIGRLDA